MKTAHSRGLQTSSVVAILLALCLIFSVTSFLRWGRPEAAQCPACEQDEKQLGVSFEEERLATVPRDLHFKGNVPIICFTPDGKSAAYLCSAGDDDQVVVVGSNRGEKFEKIRYLTYIPGGKAFAYVGERDDKAWVVVGDKKGVEFDEIGWLDRDPGSNGVAYSARKGRNWFVVFGDKRGDDFDEIGLDRVRLGERLAYSAKKDGKWFVVVGNEKSEEFDSVDGLTSDPEDKVIGYQGVIGGRVFVVLNRNKVPVSEMVRWITLGPKGKSLAYAAQKNKESYVVFQNVMGELFDEITQVTLNPQGDIVAYAARRGAKWFAMVGGKKSEAFSLVMCPTFARDGRTIAYVAVDEKTKEWFTVLGDKRGESLPGAVAPYYVTVPSWSAIHHRFRLKFTPDGKIVVWLSTVDKKQIVAGQTKSEQYDLVSEPCFSTDGRKMAFGAFKGRELWWKVVDLKE